MARQGDGEPMIAVSREPWPERHQEIEDHCADQGLHPIVADAYSAPEALAYVEEKTGNCLLPNPTVAGRLLAALLSDAEAALWCCKESKFATS
jgi:hypothetical protein